jgi:SAM-dependent methyltransferase
MDVESRQAHWEAVYASKGEREVSWFEESPAPSLDLIAEAGASPASALIDVGGGASRLVDALLDRGFRTVTVLDVSNAAIEKARSRLGDRASLVRWVISDVTTWSPEATAFDVWHDRATFHFLTDARECERYVGRLRGALKPGGHAIIATFALDGPERCSGLPVVRYDGPSLSEALGDDFELVLTRPHAHRTPSGGEQRFQFSLFRLREESPPKSASVNPH